MYLLELLCMKKIIRIDKLFESLIESHGRHSKHCIR
jgi:hypothetical protein